MLRANLLFLHVLSAMALFAAMGAEALALIQMRWAPEDNSMRPALRGLVAWRRIAGASVLLLLLSGFFLATRFWHWSGPWMGLGLLGLGLIAVIGRLVTTMLRTSFVVRLGLMIAIVYLMTVKPTW